MAELRIISLVPGATEMVYALGLKRNLVGVSDDSDFPPEVRSLPKVVATTLSPGLTSRQIDKRVRAAKHKGIGIFHVDQELLKKLAPTLILSQELCEVCAIGASEIRRAARIIRNPGRTVSLEPESVKNVMDNILLIGSETGKKREAKLIVRRLSERIKTVAYRPTHVENDAQLQQDKPQAYSRSSLSERKHIKFKSNSKKNIKLASSSFSSGKSVRTPRVLIIEWLDPLMIAGHWVPEMVELAGGSNMISRSKEISKRIAWEDVLRVNPDILIISPCGFDILRSIREVGAVRGKKGFRDLRAVKDGRVYYIDGNAYLTRPGPRIVDGIEILAEVIHPELFKRRHPQKDWQTI